MAVLCAVFVLIVLAAGEVQAQSGSGGPSFAPPQNVATGEEVFPGEMVVDVQIAGHRDLSKEQIRSYIKTRPGRPFNPDTIREDIRRLSRTRMFVNVSTEYQRTGDNVTVVFRVVERPTINYIHYLGNKRQSDTRLARETKLKVGEPLDPYTVEEARTKLIEYYKSKGMGEVHVSVMEGLKPDDRGVVFLFNEGAVQRIWDVKFEGNTIVPDGRLKTKISSKEPFLMLFGGYVNQDQIDADVSQLVQYYRDLGYRAARVGRELEFDEDRGWLTLTFHIQEGPRSTVDRVVVEGVTKFRQEDISGALKLTRGQYFERGQFNEDIARIQEIYGTAGYIFADVKPEIIEHASDNGVDIVYRIDEKQRYRVGRIEVQVRGANLHTHVRTVMNRLSIQPGDIVNIQQIRASERRLAASGLFETAPDRAPQLILQPVNEEFDGQSVADSGGVTRGQSPDPPREVPVQLQPARAHSGLSPRTDQARHRIPPPPPAGYRGQSPDEARDIMYVDAPWTQENNIQLKWKQPSNQHNQAGSRPNTSVRVAAYQQNIGGSPRPGNRAPRLGFNDSQPRVRMQSPGGFNPNPNPPRYSGPGFGGSSFAGSAVAGDNPPPSANYYGQAGQFGGSQSGQAPFNSAPTNQPSYTPPANNYGYQSNSPPPTTNPFTSGAQNPPQSSATTGQGLGTSFGAPPIPRPDELPGVPPQPGGGLVFPDGGVTPPQLDPLADIVIPVEVTQTGRFNFGVGINSDAGVVGNIVLDETNFDISRYPRSMGEVLDGRAFRGAGQHFRFEAVPGSQLQRYMVSFTEPYVFDSLFSFSTSGFFFDRRYDDWDEQRVGGTVGFGYQFQSRPDLSINFSLRGENVNVRNARLPVAPSVAAMVGDNEIWGAGVQLTHDTRDNSFLPTEGHLWQVGFEQIFGKYDFPRVNSDFRQYFLLHQRPDRSGRHVVALRGRMGITGNQTPAFEQYFAGGFSTLRGFDFRGASPVEVTSRVGGEFLLLSSVEYLFPITADDALRGVVFVDAGTVEESVKIVGSDFRVAPGAGLRIQVPGMGPAPIALDFAWAVNKEATDQTQVFSFFVGFFR
ncbi:MAG: BamA/TamA family outer membrane protein [Pirellulales bacterium]|nr:BamA/TamA family outer membrane protein [Pirellulales bacterium]